MNTAVLIALREEAPELASLPWVFFTGVGKVNAAIAATEVIIKYSPQRIINFGTAGGITVTSGLYQCTEFVQRDMNCKALGCALGQTPGELTVSIGHDTALTCSTGDHFVSDPTLSIPADIVDMEAYAIAKVCDRFGVEFKCWKYITDQANASAHSDWQQLVAQGQSHYITRLQQLGLL